MIVQRISGGPAFPSEGGRKSGSHKMDHRNWVPAGQVTAAFDIFHDGSSIFLNFRVQEPQVRAVNTAFNSPVWEDSCVEFFLSPGEEEGYYNFEFNAIGTVLGAYGRDRNHRSWLPAHVLSEIETRPSLGKIPFETLDGDVSWSLETRIPVGALHHHQIESLGGLRARANFYKCGDRLSSPHYLSWKPVLTDRPDFHTPRYFGRLAFE
jgi:hypothetical protein